MEKNGERFMTAPDFVRGFLGLYKDANYNSQSVKLLGGIIDTSKDGFVHHFTFSCVFIMGIYCTHYSYLIDAG